MGTRRLFAAGAVLLSLAGAAAICTAGYLYAERSRVHMLGGMRRISLVRAYLFNPNVRRFARVLQEHDPRADLFATIWDTNLGVSLSRKMFREVDMDGVRKYRYKPGLRKLSVHFRIGSLERNVEAEDTPELREAAEHLPPELIAFASYDEHGFRHVDAGVSGDCERRVLFLGASFTDGLWVNDGDTFASLYGKVARAHAGPRVCPVNAGVNGYGSFEERWVLEHEFETAGKPSLIFVMYFPNDVDSDYDRVMDGTLASLEARWKSSLDQVRRMQQFAVAHGSRLVLAAMPPVEQTFTRGPRTHYQDIVRAFASREGITFVDLYEGFLANDPHALYWSWDPHFTPAGHAVVANLLYDATKDFLR